MEFKYTIVLTSRLEHVITTITLHGSIDWGDGEQETVDVVNDTVSHTYAVNGYYKVAIYGDLQFIRFGVNSNDDRPDISLRTVDTPFPKSMHRATDYSNLFRGCQNLLSVPDDLFKNCKDATTIAYGFFNNTLLQAIPSSIARICGPTITRFTNCFRSCTSLKSIPAGIFDRAINATSFWGCFSDCRELETVPSDLFYNCQSATTFYQCFADDRAITSSVPELWISHPNADHYWCFYRCTNAANYASIPSDWK